MSRAALCSVALVSLAVAACGGMASGAGGGGTNVLTSQEIRDVQGQYDDMLELIRSERSLWIGSRGNVSVRSPEARFPAVFVDGAKRPGRLEALRSLDPRHVAEAEYLSASDATTRYGTGYPRGIIRIRTRRGS